MALLVAERTYPPRDSVMEAIRTAHFKLPTQPADSLLWWYSEFDFIRLPYAVTSDAVHYYLTKVSAYRGGRALFLGPYRMERARFTYRADVRFEERYQHGDVEWSDVYVVSMRLSWMNHCGPLCGLSFTHLRTVVVSRSGEVLGIDGDGECSFVVS